MGHEIWNDVGIGKSDVASLGEDRKISQLHLLVYIIDIIDGWVVRLFLIIRSFRNLRSKKGV